MTRQSANHPIEIDDWAERAARNAPPITADQAALLRRLVAPVPAAAPVEISTPTPRRARRPRTAAA